MHSERLTDGQMLAVKQFLVYVTYSMVHYRSNAILKHMHYLTCQPHTWLSTRGLFMVDSASTSVI